MTTWRTGTQARVSGRLRWRALALAGALCAPAVGAAQPVEIPATYGGDFWTRPRLTGDWFGLRDELGKKGVSLDVDVLMTPQGVATGGRNTGAEFWGDAEYTLGVDTGKLGLWPGGFLNVRGVTTYGNSIQKDSGAVVPVNTVLILTETPDQPTSALMNLSFMQFLSKKFGLVAGKLYTLADGDANAFAQDFHTTFVNTSFNFNTTLDLVPFSAYGGGIVVLPWEGATFTVSVIDPSGRPTNNDISEAFNDGVLLNGQGRVTVKPFGLVGHQLLGFIWSNKERISLEQDPSNLARMLLQDRFPRLADPGRLLERILERFFPQLLVPVKPINTTSDTWSIYYNFDQFLWSPAGNPNRGIGAFFRFGASDGVANPLKYMFSAGISGQGIVPGRPNDTFGFGWARTEISGNFVPFLRQRLNLGLDKEDVYELYYNAAVTKWLGATADLQIIDPALKKTLDSSSRRLEDNNTSVLLGLRIYAGF